MQEEWQEIKTPFGKLVYCHGCDYLRRPYWHLEIDEEDFVIEVNRHIQIIYFEIFPEFRCQGFGSQMLRYFLKKCDKLYPGVSIRLALPGYEKYREELLVRFFIKNGFSSTEILGVRFLERV
ncbi:MAG: hypothetical protein Q4C96_11000 [Planctomycetia bacterium]|nr:hypothetical protein [Planctomycetia bacterium]